MAKAIETASFANKVRSDFSKAAGRYDEYAILQRKVCDELFAKIKHNLCDSQVILDVGSGTGYMHELLRKNQIYSTLFQTDISYQMCKIAKLYGSSGKFGNTYSFVSDIERLAIKDNFFDTVISSLCLQWTDLEGSLNSIKQTLKNNGLIAFSTILDGTFKELVDLSDLRVNDFLQLGQVSNLFKNLGVKNSEIYSKEIVIYHDNLRGLLSSIKNIGAKYKGEKTSKFRGKKYFIDLEEKYFEKYSVNGKIPLTWYIGFAVNAA